MNSCLRSRGLVLQPDEFDAIAPYVCPPGTLVSRLDQLHIVLLSLRPDQDTRARGSSTIALLGVMTVTAPFIWRAVRDRIRRNQ